MNVIEIKKLKKKFGNFTAVNGIDLKLKKGEIFGFLGPNGAGKTTTISMLSTILKPTSGTANIMGFNIEKDTDNVRKSIGIVFQDPALDFELTGRENLYFHGRMYGVEKGLMKKRIEELLKMVDLEEKADVLVKKYSGGMKRRLEIARGLIHHPKVLFLDEPTLGLDPQTRRKIWEYVKNLNKKEEITIILTTHYLEEADYLCDRIGIIDNGKLIALGAPDKLKDIIGGDVITMKTNDNERLLKIFKSEKYMKSQKIVSDMIELCVVDGDSVIPKIIRIANKNKIDIKTIRLKKPTLEDVFIHYTGKNIRTETPDSNSMMKLRMRH